MSSTTAGTSTATSLIAFVLTLFFATHGPLQIRRKMLGALCLIAVAIGLGTASEARSAEVWTLTELCADIGYQTVTGATPEEAVNNFLGPCNQHLLNFAVAHGHQGFHFSLGSCPGTANPRPCSVISDGGSGSQWNFTTNPSKPASNCTAGDNGVQSFFTGWKYKPAIGNWTPGFPLTPTSYCADGCLVTVGENTSGTCPNDKVGFGCQHTTPNANGLYAKTEFFTTAKTGATCDGNQNPGSPTGGACPGSVGTVGGTTICVPKDAGPTTTSGATTSGAGVTNSTSTTTDAGGSSTTNSSSTTTTNPNGTTTTTTTTTTTGTGSAAGAPAGGGPGRGAGTGTPQVNTCGLPGEAPCKIDETGTGNGSGAYDGPTAGLGTATDDRKSGLGTVVDASGKQTDWGGLLPPMPSGSCPNFTVFSVGDRAINFNLCPYENMIKAFMTFLWVTSTWFACVALVKRTMDGN